jgi:hypothetical protein
MAEFTKRRVPSGRRQRTKLQKSYNYRATNHTRSNRDILTQETGATAIGRELTTQRSTASSICKNNPPGKVQIEGAVRLLRRTFVESEIILLAKSASF